MKRGKKYNAVAAKIDVDKSYEIDEAVKLVKESGAGRKFDQTVDIAIKLGIDPKAAEQAIRGSVSLPKGTGRSKRVVAFCQGSDMKLATDAGAIEAGSEELVAKVNGGWLDFDVAVATTEMMPKVGKLGRVLGPKGLMPSPKSGTVGKDVATMVREFAAGKVEFRNDDGGSVHAPVGKASFSEEDLKNNIVAFVSRIRSMRPASTKGLYIQRVVVSCTMGPGIQVNLS
jgi:large subunit ribosomal protein L1